MKRIFLSKKKNCKIDNGIKGDVQKNKSNMLLFKNKIRNQ